MAGANAITWKREAGAGPVLSYRAPFSLDTIVGFLNATLFKPASILLLPLFAYAQGVHKGQFAAPSFASLDAAQVFGDIKSSVLDTTWLRRLYYFIIFLNFHKAATRYVKNLGHYARDPTNFKNEVIVVTGGSAGIGRSIVELLTHKHRARVAVLDMAPPTYAPAPAGAHEILYIKTDVTSKESVKAAADQIRAHFKIEPTVLINNAGIAMGGTILEMDLDAVLRVWRVNALSHYVTLQEFLPALIKKGHGHVVTVASSASYMSIPHLSPYATSKAAALSLHEALTGELRARYPNARKIRTSVACPTKVRTQLGDGLQDQPNQFTTPTLEPIQVAERIVGALENGLSTQIIMPWLMNVLPVVSRGPAWLRRVIEVVGKTDISVTDDGMKRAIANGYHKTLTSEEDKSIFAKALQQFDSKK